MILTEFILACNPVIDYMDFSLLNDKGLILEVSSHTKHNIKSVREELQVVKRGREYQGYGKE